MDHETPSQRLARIEALEALRDTAVGTGDRRFQRHQVRGNIELIKTDETRQTSYPVVGNLRDGGLGGVGFVTEEALDVGSSYRICFVKSGSIVESQPAVVRHSRCLDDSTYLVGAQFCAELGLMHLMDVNEHEIAKLDAGPPQESDAFLGPDDLNIS